MLEKRLVAAAVLAWGVLSASAQSIDKTVATVRLTKFEVITQKQLERQIAILVTQRDILQPATAEKPLTAEDRKKVLEQMIVNILYAQAAERDKVYVSDAELKSRLETTRKQVAASLRLTRDLTDAEFQQFVKQYNGLEWDEYLRTLRSQILVYTYVRFKKKAQLDAIKAPTDEEAVSYYESNKRSFFMPDYVKLRHIYIDTRNLGTKEEREKALKRAEDIARELKNGAAFDDLAMKYSDDTSSKYKGGDIGFLSREDEQRAQLLGKGFIDAAFRLKAGETSGVVSSNVGYHILKVDELVPARILAYDDLVPPENKTRVKDSIKDALAANRQYEAIVAAEADVTAALKKEAEIRITEGTM